MVIFKAIVYSMKWLAFFMVVSSAHAVPTMVFDWHDVISPWMPVRINEPLLVVIKNLKKQGCKCVIASHMSSKEYTWWQKHYPEVIALFDTAYVGQPLNKKNPLYFENLLLFLQAQSIAIESIVFIDDKKKHVDVAGKIGNIKGICYSSVEKLRDSLYKMGIFCD